MIEVREITEKEDFESFNLSARYTLFLQSWNYGQQLEALNEKIIRVGVYDNNKLVGIAQCVQITAKRGSHFFCPYGPVFSEWKKSYFEAFVDHLWQIGKRNGLTFLRISPFLANSKKNYQLFKDLGFIDAPMHVVAENTWLLDLNNSEKKLLSQMRKNNRKLINRAKRDGVTVHRDTSDEAIEHFIRLHKDTKVKHDFTPYPDDFFREQVRSFRKDDQVVVFNAEYNGEIIGSAIVMYYGNMAAYHHGANSIKHQKIPASYLIQWEAILEAKKRGMQNYNFWGVSPDKDRPHPISGVSHFKRGFGGEQFDLIHAQDLAISPLYGINWMVETVRRKRRGYYFKRPQ